MASNTNDRASGICVHCDGTGKHGGNLSSPNQCSACRGTGRCSHCKGTGQVYSKPCPLCYKN
jgi:hypothetical protein